MNHPDKIHLAGHRGPVGSAIKKRLEALDYVNIRIRTHAGTRRAVDLFAGPQAKRAMAQWET